MGVTIVFSSTNGGTALSSPVNHGNLSGGSTTTEQLIHIRHTGTNPITATSIYMEAMTDAEYGGDFTASADKTELLSWGDASTSDGFGGVAVNMNATGSFPDASWPTLANKTTVDGFGFAIRTGVGNSSTNPLTILSVTGATSNGTVQAGTTPNVRFQMRITAPVDSVVLGTRQFNTKLKFTSTT